MERLETIKDFLAISAFITIIIFGVLVFSFIYIDNKQRVIRENQYKSKIKERNDKWQKEDAEWDKQQEAYKKRIDNLHNFGDKVE